MKLLKKYKWFVLGFFILCAIILVWFLKDLFLNTDGALYGHRLEGVSDVSITEDIKVAMSDFLLETEGIKKINTNVHGKIFNIIVLVDETVTIDKIKEITNASLDKCSEEVKGFYDISFLIDYEEKTEAKDFPKIGYKNKNKDQIVW